MRLALAIALVTTSVFASVPVRSAGLPDAPPLTLEDYGGVWSPLGGWGDEAGDLTLEEGGLRFSNNDGLWKGRVFVRKDGSALFIPDEHLEFPGGCRYDVFRLVGPSLVFSRVLRRSRYSEMDMTTLTPSNRCDEMHYGQR